MKLEVQPRDDHQVKINVEFEPSVLEEFVRRAARKIARETRVPGFRPGKAPLDVIRRMVGDEALHQQAVEDLIDEYYPKVLEEADIKPGAPGSLEEIVSLSPPKLAFLVPLQPDVELGDYKEIRHDYPEIEVTEADVDEFIKRLQTNYGTAEPVERPAENGDLVYLKFSGKLTQPAEGEEEIVFPERPAQFIVGSDVIQDRNWPYPGFNDMLLGLKAEDEKTILHTFSEDWEDQALRGKEVQFDLTVQSVKSLHLPEINDEFAQTVGQFDTVEDLRKAIREQLETSKQEEVDDLYFTELFGKVIAGSTIKYPPQVLDHEVDHILEHLQDDLAKQGMEMDTYFKMLNKDRETYLEEEVRPAARKRLERSLVMEKLAEVEGIKMTDASYQEAVQDTIQALQSMPQPKKGGKNAQKEIVDAVAMNSISRKFNQLILARMKAIATGQADQEPAPVAEDVQAVESVSEPETVELPVANTAESAPSEDPKPARKRKTKSTEA